MGATWRTRWQRCVDGAFLAFAFPCFFSESGVRIPGALVGAEKEHTAITIKDVLRAIAMVYVPIHDQHLLCTVLLLRMTRADGDVVKEAKSHALRWSGVMPWWAHGAKCVG